MKALLVFQDKGSHWLSWALKRGFRHVALAVLDERGYWIVVDAKEGIPSVRLETGGAFDLAGHYRKAGFTVIETEQRETAPIWPFAAANCVGLVKGILAIRAPFVFTPWQLYKHVRHHP